jgi:NAD(P)-dependent dehydrogenase (short-subunit alcohol dehydrogenase family)
MSWNIGAGLEGKGVIVTGAAGGIGREVALAFAKAGSRVAAVDINEKGVAEVVAAMEGGPHLALGIDLRDIAGHKPLVAKVQASFGRLDVMANTAAILIRRSHVDQVTEEDGISSTIST